eukprot:6195020-Pleurochrysis_carterae.AAC.1
MAWFHPRDMQASKLARIPPAANITLRAGTAAALRSANARCSILYRNSPSMPSPFSTRSRKQQS